jgi:hypothetical protein
MTSAACAGRLAKLLAGFLLGVLPTVASGESPAIHRDDAKAYRALRETGRLPTLDRGDADRRLAAPWPPPRRQPADAALGPREARRQLLEATCDADLVVVGRVADASPLAHPNGRWVFTAYDVVVVQAVRSKDAAPPVGARLRYLHPSGSLTVAGRLVTAVLDGFAPLAGDPELLLFLVRVGKGPTYRTSMRVPPLALRDGRLHDPGAAADGRRAAMDGTSALAAIKAVSTTVCRPPTAKHERRPSDEDWPWPEPPL